MPASAESPSARTVEFVSSADGLAQLAEHLGSQETIAFDTEFLREKTFFPQLALIQVADEERSWVVDPLKLSLDEMRPLLAVLTSPATLKVAHAVEQDQECLHKAYGIVAEPLLDTAIAAALTGRGDQIGLGPLLAKLTNVRLPKGHTRTNWMKRPLPPAMLDYAADDVAYLVEAAQMLKADLERLDRLDWAMQISADFGLSTRTGYDVGPMAKKLAGNSRLNATSYAVLKELVVWREEYVRRKDIPRRWLAEDQVLVRLAIARPRKASELEDFRGLGPKVRERGADSILEAIRRGESIPQDQLESPPRKEEPTAKEAAASAILKCFLTTLAAENKVPLRFLVDNGSVLGLLRGRFESSDDLRASGLLASGTVDMFGDDLIAILSGRRALRIVNGRAQHWTP